MKSLLKITPEQESTWQAFATTMQNQYANKNSNRAERTDIPNMSTPERLDAMRAHRLERMEKADQRDNAIKSLYAALSPEQQKTMDDHMQKMKKHMEHGGHRDGSAPQP
jgi:protein CpxP